MGSRLYPLLRQPIRHLIGRNDRRVVLLCDFNRVAEVVPMAMRDQDEIAFHLLRLCLGERVPGEVGIDNERVGAVSSRKHEWLR